MSFTFEHYDISLSQTENDVTIRILDNKLFRIYQNTYDKISLHNFGIGTLSNFYKLCFNCLTSLGKIGVTKESIENGQVKSFQIISSTIIIDMYFERDFIYEIKLDVPQIEEVKMSSDKIIIKKLADEIKELRKCTATIERYHDLMMILEVPICRYTDINGGGESVDFTLSIPLLCTLITIKHDAESTAFTNKLGHICINKINILNTNLKKVQNDTLKIVGAFEDTIMDMSNMPSSTTCIEFSGLKCLTTVSNMCHMKNIKKITFTSCPKLTNIFNTIKDLQISEIVINNCPKFLEASIITMHKIKLTVSKEGEEEKEEKEEEEGEEEEEKVEDEEEE
jgi:hypothetical protein